MKYANLVELADESNFNVGYSEVLKGEFKRLGRKLLKDLAKALMDTDQFVFTDVSYNPSGIAVSGDHCLQAEFKDGGGIYMNVSFQSFGNSYGFYRATKGHKDYTGGVNRQLGPNLILNMAALVKELTSANMKTEAQELRSAA